VFHLHARLVAQHSVVAEQLDDDRAFRHSLLGDVPVVVG
jgi:hypothetical protein